MPHILKKESATAPVTTVPVASAAAATAPVASSAVASTKSTTHDEATKDFCILLRLEGKQGMPIKRILLNGLSDKTWNGLAEEAISRTFPDDEEPILIDKYIVNLKDCTDKEWNIDIDTTDDLDRSIKQRTCEGFVKMSAHVRRKSDPPPPVPDSPASVVILPSPVATGAKRKASAFGSGAKPKTISTVKKRKSAAGSGGGACGKNKGSVSERILGSLGQLLAIGISDAPRIQLALFSGYSNVNSAGFAKALSQLKKDGMIEYPSSKTVSFSAAGRETEEAKSITPPKDNDAVHAQIKSLLKPIQIKMFDLLADGAIHTRKELAAGMGYTNLNSAGFAKSLSSMSSLGLIHYPKDDADKKKKLVQLTSVCFPFKVDADTVFRQPTPPIMPNLPGIM